MVFFFREQHSLPRRTFFFYFMCVYVVVHAAEEFIVSKNVARILKTTLNSSVTSQLIEKFTLEDAAWCYGVVTHPFLQEESSMHGAQHAE